MKKLPTVLLPPGRARNSHLVVAFGALLLAIIATGDHTTTASELPRVAYSVAVEKPGDKEFDVTVRVEGVGGETVDLAMPTWLPGVYRVQNYAEAVRRFVAVDDTGKPLNVTMPSKNVWRVASHAASFTAQYALDVSRGQKLYSKSQVADRVGVIQAGTALLFLPGHREASVSLKLDLPEAWRVATALDGGPREFTAVDYDELVDSPVLFGEFTRLDFKIRGIPFAVVADKRLKFDIMKLGALNSKLADAQIEMFGSAPFPEYLFLYMVTEDASGRGDESIFLGLEHDESTLITLHPRLALSEDLSVRWLAEVSSHELFHAWNVRAIKPTQLVLPDYLEAPPVRTLWLLEGATSYYAKRFVAATLMSREAGKEWLFAELANSLSALESRESLEELSLEAGTSGPEAFYKLYPRGEATALLLDLQIRADSHGRLGLDDVLRQLYEMSRTRQGFEEEKLPKLIADVTGRDYSEFFRRYIGGREKPPVGDVLGLAGWSLATRAVGAKGFARSIAERERPSALQQRIREGVLGQPRTSATSAVLRPFNDPQRALGLDERGSPPIGGAGFINVRSSAP
jgi:predicted metalloprotease with PDZ domain